MHKKLRLQGLQGCERGNLVIMVIVVIAWTQGYRREELEAEVGLRLWHGFIIISLKVNNKYDTVYKTIQWKRGVRWVWDVTLHVVLKGPHVCFER